MLATIQGSAGSAERMVGWWRQHFISLLDNYVAQTGTTETYTEEERVEMNQFLSACCRTRVMQYLADFLVKKGKIRRAEELKAFLNDMWFKLYRREVRESE